MLYQLDLKNRQNNGSNGYYLHNSSTFWNNRDIKQYQFGQGGSFDVNYINSNTSILCVFFYSQLHYFFICNLQFRQGLITYFYDNYSSFFLIKNFFCYTVSVEQQSIQLLILFFLINQILACEFDFIYRKDSTESSYDIPQAEFIAFGVQTRYYAFYLDILGQPEQYEYFNQTFEAYQIMKGYYVDGTPFSYFIIKQSQSLGQFFILNSDQYQQNLKFKDFLNDESYEGVQVFTYMGLDKNQKGINTDQFEQQQYDQNVFLSQKNHTFQIMISEIGDSIGNKGGALNLVNKTISSIELLESLLTSSKVITFGKDIVSAPQSLTISLDGGNTLQQAKFLNKTHTIIQEIVIKQQQSYQNSQKQSILALQDIDSEKIRISLDIKVQDNKQVERSEQDNDIEKQKQNIRNSFESIPREIQNIQESDLILKEEDLQNNQDEGEQFNLSYQQ